MDTNIWYDASRSLLVIFIVLAIILFFSFFLPLLICRLCKNNRYNNGNEHETDLLENSINYKEIGFWNWDLETGTRTNHGSSMEVELKELKLNNPAVLKKESTISAV